MSAQYAETSLPRVNGRHQNRTLAAARKQRAIELKTHGMTYQQIADELGYTSRATVYAIIRDAQAKYLVETVEDHRAQELARLEQLHAALWPKAMAGDAAAVMALLRISDRRLRLHGIHLGSRRKDPRAHWDSCQGPPTVVVRSDDCRHTGCIQHGQFPSTALLPEAATTVRPCRDSSLPEA